MADSDLDTYLTPDLLVRLGDAVTVIDAQWRYRYASPAAVEIIGRPLPEIIGAEVWSIFPEAVGTPQYDACVRAMEERTRERVVWFFDSVGRWYEQFAIPAGDGLVILVNDVTEQERLTRRSEQLVAIGQALAGANTAEEINSVLATQALGVVGATGGSIVLADEERGVMRAVDLTGIDAEVPSTWEEFPLSRVTPGTDAIRTGRPVYVADADASKAAYPEVVGVLQQLGRSTLAALPLASSGVRLGALIVLFPQHHVVDIADEQFLTTTAAMAAQALVRAQLLEAERRTMSALQRSLLPPKLPAVGGLQLVARYVVSDASAEVGGDWYDVIPLQGGAVGLVMGDVEGHDLGAAALMGLIRSAVRAYAIEGHPPAMVLGRANVFLDSLRRGRIVTVSYAQLHPVERLVTAVSAGHIGIQVVTPEGLAFEVPSEVGPPLGVVASGMLWPETTSTIEAGSVFAMFTDGLVEVRDRDIDVGIERVRRDMVTHKDAVPDAIADVLLGEHPVDSFDDVALLVGRMTAPAELSRRLTRRLPPTPASVFLARRFTCQVLAAWEVRQDVVDVVELVMSELVTNAARHSEDEVAVRMSCDEERIRIEVEDTSHRMPVDAPSADDVDEEATGGRGLLLVDSMASRWGVVSEGLSKHVWAEFDLAAQWPAAPPTGAGGSSGPSAP